MVNKRKRQSTTCAVICGTLIMIALAIAVAPVTARAQEDQDLTTYKNRFDGQVGYFLGRREIFRDIYGNDISLGMGFERRFSSTSGVALRLGFVKLDKSGTLKYSNWSAAPMYTRTLFESGSLRGVAGLGLGLSYRVVSYEGITQAYGSETEINVSWGETNLFGTLMTGLEFRLSPRLFAGARVLYDYHIGKDPDVGGYGDTGGLNFTGSVGVGF